MLIAIVWVNNILSLLSILYSLDSVCVQIFRLKINRTVVLMVKIINRAPMKPPVTAMIMVALSSKDMHSTADTLDNPVYV